MKEILDIPLEEETTKNWKLLYGFLGGVVIVAVILFAGMKLDQAMTPTPLPANAQCQASVDAVKQGIRTFQVQMLAALDGKDAPSPDISAVKAAVIDCKANEEIYSVKVGK